MRGVLAVMACLAMGSLCSVLAGPLDKGKWEIVKLERDGKADDQMVGAVRVHDGTTYTITPKKGDPFKGMFKVDDTAKPKTIDMIPDGGRYKGQTLRGIYEVDGDMLKLCFATSPELARPTEFTSKQGYVLAIHKALK